MSKKSREAILSNLSRVLDPPAPPRRRGANLDGLLNEYSPPEQEKPQPLSPAPPSTADESPVREISHVTQTRHVTETSHVSDASDAVSETWHAPETSHVLPASHVSENTQNLAVLAETLKYGEGHARINHDYFDGFKNISISLCTLQGYPRFEVLNSAGRLVRGGRAADGLKMLGDEAEAPPNSVTLRPGAEAAFLVYYNAGGAGRVRLCPTYGKVRITAPGTGRGFVLRESLRLCRDLRVSPVGSPAAGGR